MKVIFLDFDGVLNSEDNATVLGLTGKDNDEILHFDERCMRWLLWIVQQTDCKIVVSSSWRLEISLKDVQEWAKENFLLDVIDYTPFNTDVELDENGDVVFDFIRGKEIQEWIDKNKPNKYCIIDDENQMLPNQIFVQTDPKFGLTYQTSKKVVEYLNSEN